MLKLGLRGILRLTLFKDVTMLSGCGVGGGSLVYANTLYRPPEHFYRDGQWEGMTDWEEALEPHYDTAERMLGAAKIPGDDRATRCSGRLLFTLMVGPGSRLGRPLNLGRTLIRSPRHVLAALAPGSWARRTLILLVMQTLDNAMAFRARRQPFRRVWLTTRQDPDRPTPSFIPAANEAAERVAAHVDGIAQSSVLESVAGIPVTAHILGGAPIGPDAESGVVDGRSRAYGYENLLVCDGAAVPANPGVNPSLTITALAEHAMSHIPPGPRDGSVPKVRMTAEPPARAPQPAPGTASGG